MRVYFSFISQSSERKDKIDKKVIKVRLRMRNTISEYTVITGA